MFFINRIKFVSFIALLLAVSVALGASAAVVITVEEVGNDVVLTGSGTLDVSALTEIGNNNTSGSAVFINASFFAGVVRVGVPTDIDVQATPIDVYDNGIIGGGPFGTSGPRSSSIGSGDVFGVSFAGGATPNGRPVLDVPRGYVSGTELSGTGTYPNATYQSLGLTPGTYIWSWGAGTNADSLTLIIPEPSSLLILGFGGFLIASHRHHRST